MDITDYNAMLCAIDITRNLKVPFEKRAKEIAMEIIGSDVDAVVFSEEKVTCVYRDEYARTEQEARYGTRCRSVRRTRHPRSNPSPHAAHLPA